MIHRIREYEDEQKELLYTVLEEYWFKGMKNGKLRCELFLDAKCNQNCKYCYLTKFGKEIYPVKATEEQIVNNAKMTMNWFIENDLYPSPDIFSGEATIRKMFYEVVDYIITRYSEDGVTGRFINVPTNYTFLLDDNLIKKMEETIQKARENGIRINLSASVDGKYMEQNRPIKMKKDPRDDSFYDKMFAFNAKYGYGFHPMIYSKNIDKWKANFLWFMNNFRKYDIPPYRLYLLEVRNPEWTVEEIRMFGDFVEWLAKWTWDNIAKSDENRFYDFIMKYRGFNILHSIFAYSNKGISCSIQTMLTIRMGDLAIIPCHRTGYDLFKIANLVVKDGKIADIEPHNVEIGISIWSADADNFPYCESCPINKICTHGCLGAQYEFTGDLFTPIPTVCALEHQKAFSLIKAYRDLGVFDMFYYAVHPSLRPSLEWVYEKVEEVKKNDGKCREI